MFMFLLENNVCVHHWQMPPVCVVGKPCWCAAVQDLQPIVDWQEDVAEHLVSLNRLTGFVDLCADLSSVTVLSLGALALQGSDSALCLILDLITIVESCRNLLLLLRTIAIDCSC